MESQLQRLLRDHSLRVTAPRRAVFTALAGEPALSIRELRSATAGRLDTASLYRTLNLFRRLGIIQDVVIAGRRKLELADAFAPHHHHIACARCHTAIAIHDEAFERHIERLATSHGFTHDSHSFEITGLCPNCSRATAGGRSVPAA